jgi:purine-binding chemotaxis protein CheW
MDSSDRFEAQVVVFEMADAAYGLFSDNVVEIVRIVQINPVPEAPDYVSGVIDYRGELVPVVDLMKRMGLGKAEAGLSSLFIIVETDNRKVGFLIDKVVDVATLELGKTMAAPKGIPLSEELISGATEYENRLLIILNADKILDFADPRFNELLKGA